MGDESLTSENRVYKKSFELHAYEVDSEGRAHFVSLLNYLQDAAGDHAALLGFSITELLKKNQTWLLSRYHLKVLRYPLYEARVMVSTWPSATQGIFALRDFEMADEKGQVFLMATSSWILLDLGKKQPIRLNESFPGRMVLERRALDDDFKPFPQLRQPEIELTFPVLRKDLDFNRHVNNAVYVQWALEAVPEVISNSMRPLDVEVSYRAEAFSGDRVISRAGRQSGETPPVFLHQISNEATGAELTRLKTVWSEKV
jgi:medium-chain acyl-[acyl-carrier-protein] hydrolase